MDGAGPESFCRGVVNRYHLNITTFAHVRFSIKSILYRCPQIEFHQGGGRIVYYPTSGNQTYSRNRNVLQDPAISTQWNQNKANSCGHCITGACRTTLCYLSQY